MNKRKINLFMLGGIIVMFIVWLFFVEKQLKDRYIRFNTSSINGKLTDVYPVKGATAVVFGNREFIFVPIYINNATDFPYFAKKGDSVFKPAKADTLKLFHNGKVFLYTFKKF